MEASKPQKTGGRYGVFTPWVWTFQYYVFVQLHFTSNVEREASQTSWFMYAGGHGGKDHPFWHFWRLICGFDPVPVLEKVRCPVLAVRGAKDTFLPPKKSARIWQAAQTKAGNKNAMIKVFPDGGHSLIVSKTGGLKETARAQGFVPGYFGTLREWTRKPIRFQ